MFFSTSSYQPPKENPMLGWLLENEKLIGDGAASYEGERITKETVLTRFTCVGSMIFVTMRTSSPWLVKDSEAATAAFRRCTAVTMFFGWWSLFGMIYTPEALYNNFSGGTKRTVAELLYDLHNPAQAVKKQNALSWKMLLIFPIGILVSVLAIIGYAIITKGQ
jgi:hypothetical protein